MVSEIDLPTANEVVYFIETSQRLLTLLNARLREFFVLVSSESPSHQSKKISSTQLDAIVNITASIYACPIFVRRGLSVDILKHIQVELLESLQSRYHGHVGISTTKNGPADVALITLTDLICKDLMIYHTEFDILLHGAIHIPTLAAWAFYKPLSIQLDEFSRTFKALSSDMSIVFDLYKSVRKLQKVCEQIDFKLADQFPMVEWFIHFVTEWLSYTETKVCDWVKAALDHDNYEKLSAFALHSSSVLDLFTSFQQLIDFIKELDWPNESESRRFYFEIFYDITNAIDRYAGLSKDFMVKELALKKSLQPPPPPKKAQFGKIKVTIPKRIRKKQPIANPEETRISTKACVMLLNIRAIPERLRALSSQVPNINDPVNINVVDKRLFGSNRFLYTLSILNANLQPIRPWNTKLSIRVSNKVGKDLGSTEPILQGTDIAWNSKLYGISHYTINSLVVSLVHHLEGQSPSLFAMGTLSLLPLQRNGIHEENVQLAQYGFVKIRLQVLDYDMNHFNELTELYTGIAEKKLIGLMVDQVIQ
ncbi:hypothetical protein BC833DRAFT_316048 [Globomyces pollinis-pini]|nr:hypothetical protein BC833DRAFT_316048 [Globomyces pollinis-pini]